MGLERHANKVYYYRKVRKVNGVFSEYVCSGENAIRYAAMEAEFRVIKRNLLSEENRLHDELSTSLDLSQKLLHSLVVATLLVSGFYHHRGEYRLRNQKAISMKTEICEHSTPSEDLPNITAEQFRGMVHFCRSNPKDLEAVSALRNALHSNPQLITELETCIQKLENKSLAMFSENPIDRVLLQCQLSATKSQLLADEPNILLKLSADMVAVCVADYSANQRWLQDSYDMMYNTKREYHRTKMLDAAQRRLLKSLEIVNLVRKVSNTETIHSSTDS